jgi:hypothetical protein
MLTREDCLGLSELTEAEIAAIADHEHIPEMVALALGNYLVHLPDGGLRISRIILDDIDAAAEKRDLREVARLKLVLKNFCECHPNALRRTLAA